MFDMIEKTDELRVLALSIEDAFKDVFPNGYVHARVGVSMGTNPILSVSLGLIGSLSDCSNKIRHNDPAFHTFLVYTEKDGNFEASNGIGSLSVNPPKDSYLAMDSVKTKYRKTTGNSAKVLKSFVKHFERMQSLVAEHRANIYKVENIDPKYFEFANV